MKERDQFKRERFNLKNPLIGQFNPTRMKLQVMKTMSKNLWPGGYSKRRRSGYQWKN